MKTFLHRVGVFGSMVGAHAGRKVSLGEDSVDKAENLKVHSLAIKHVLLPEQ